MGTCKLGDVVNETLLVEGFENLRIADASVIPVMSAHPNAAVAMIAEYVSDVIKARYMSAKAALPSTTVFVVLPSLGTWFIKYYFDFFQ